MSIAFDSHTHTLMSGHAFSTIEEYAAACSQNGMEGFATTDHGPSMVGGPHVIYFYNLASLPRNIRGVTVLRGVEANIVDFEGKLDVPEAVLKRLDVVIASYHDIVLPPKTAEDHTAAWLAVIENPLVDIVGHSGRGPFPYDIQTVLKACREADKAIEINNHTLNGIKAQHNCLAIAQACRKHGVKVVINSDAHFSGEVGQVDDALAMLDDIGFPHDLIVNLSLERYWKWLINRKPWLEALT